MQHDLFSSLASFKSAAFNPLMVRDSAGGYRVAEAAELLQAAQRLLAAQLRGSDVMTSPAVVKDFLRTRLAMLPHEVFAVVHLDLCVVPINVQSAEQPQVLKECPVDLLHITRSS